MPPRNRQIDLQNLKKYPEFFALKQEMEEFCNQMDSLSDIDLAPSRIALNEEIAGRVWARDKVRDLLASLGLVDKTNPKVKDKTGE